MPANRSVPTDARFTGWFNGSGATLDVYYKGTKVASASSALWAITGAGSATTTLTAGTGLTVTTGNEVNALGDHRVTAGNARLGVVSAFVTTEPTSAYIMKAGTAAAGAILTSGGIMTDGTNVQKIIADGTVSAVET